MWVSVWKKLSGENTTISNRDNIRTYQVESVQQAWEQLKAHWKEYNHLFSPRAAFVVNDKTLEWEQVVDQVIPI